jgi:hypothetical protein
VRRGKMWKPQHGGTIDTLADERTGNSPDYLYPRIFNAKCETPARSASEGNLFAIPRLRFGLV